jgi:hypothetical protein
MKIIAIEEHFGLPSRLPSDRLILERSRSTFSWACRSPRPTGGVTAHGNAERLLGLTADR